MASLAISPQKLQRLGIMVLMLGALLLIAYELATIVVNMLEDRPTHAVPTEQQATNNQPTQRFTPAALFGRSEKLQQVATPRKLVESDLNLSLFGVMQGNTKQLALIANGNQSPQIFAPGDTVLPGAKLVEIASNHVILNHRNQDKILRINIEENPIAESVARSTTSRSESASSIRRVNSAMASSAVSTPSVSASISPTGESSMKTEETVSTMRSRRASRATGEISSSSTSSVTSSNSSSSSATSSSSSSSSSTTSNSSSDSDDSDSDSSESTTDSSETSDSDADSSSTESTTTSSDSDTTTSDASTDESDDSSTTTEDENSEVVGGYDGSGDYLIPEVLMEDGHYELILE
jgi:hypothetical protein